MKIRQWLKRYFNSDVGAEMASESDCFERCSCCGQTYNTRDLQQVLPHFEHQLALGAEPIRRSLSNEDLQPPLGNVVPFRRAARTQAGNTVSARS